MCIEDSMNRIAEYETLIEKERKGIVMELKETKVELTYQQLFDFAKKFRKLSANEIRVINYLMEHGRTEMSLADFTRAIGQPDKYAGNIGKAFDELAERGIVCVERKKDTGKKRRNAPMTACYISDKWVDVFFDNDENE